MSTLAKRLAGDCCHTSRHGFRVMPSGRPSLAKRLERMEAYLPLTLSLKDYPIVVPARQQLAGEAQLVHLQRTHVGCRIHQPVSQPLCHADVDDDLRGKAQAVPSGANEIKPELF